MDERETFKGLVMCGCDEYPECIHVLYWIEGRKSADAELAEKDRRIAELEGKKSIMTPEERAHELGLLRESDGLLNQREVFLLEEIDRREREKAALEALIVAGMALTDKWKAEQCLSIARKKAINDCADELRAALKGES